MFASGRFAPKTYDSMVASLHVATTPVRALVASSTALLRVLSIQTMQLGLEFELEDLCIPYLGVLHGESNSCSSIYSIYGSFGTPIPTLSSESKVAGG